MFNKLLSWLKFNKKEGQNGPTSDSLYLAKLEFNPELRKTWLNFFVSNFRVVILLIILLTTLGVYSFSKLPRESNPEVKIPIAVVSTLYPGASPADVEELVTKKIETAVSGIKGIKKISSSSANSFSAVTVEFDAGQNLDDSIRRLRDKIISVKNDLPSDTQEPNVIEISLDDTPIWTIALTGTLDGYRLRNIGDDIKDELEKIAGVRQVNVSGGDEKEFSVSYDPQKLSYYGISADQANQAIKAANLAIPAGNFDGKDSVYPIRSDGRFFDAEKLANTPITHSDEGTAILLKDIAKVEERFIKKTVYARLSIGGSAPMNAVTISIIKKTGESITNTVDQAKAVVDSMIKKYPAGSVNYGVNMDLAKQIRKDFNQLSHDFALTLILVFGILFLIVGLKEAVVAGLAIPLVFFSTFGVMLATGISLNFLSIFSLILSLGLLVDDAIVVVSATKQYLRTGKYTPEEAVLLVLNDFKIVLTTTTLTTVWAFLPLLQSTGIIGEFIKSIPIAVSVTLISSLLIALMINHPLAAVLERIRTTRKFFWILVVLCAGGALWLFTLHSYLLAVVAGIFLGVTIWMLRWYEAGGKKVLVQNELLSEKEWDDDELIKKKLQEQGGHKDENVANKLIHGIIHFNAVLPYYEKYLRKILATKKSGRIFLGVVLGLFLVAIALPLTGIVKSEFFAASNMETIYIGIRAPTGMKLDKTNILVTQVEDKLLRYPEITNFSTIVGKPGQSSRISSAGGGSSDVASITITLNDAKQRNITSYDLAKKIREDMKDIPATISVDSPKGGPPSGSAFEARITGDDLSVLNTIAHDLKPYLESIPGVVNADISLKDAPAEYTFTLDPVKMEQNNLNAAYVGSILRMAISGSEVSTVIRGNKEIKIIARYEEDKLPDLASVQNLQILNLRKQSVYIKDVAKIDLKPSVDAISRIDQKRVVLLSAGVAGKTLPNAVLAEFQNKVAKGYKIPEGYSIVYGGENEQNTESVISILRAMVMAALLIISTLIIQFNSFKKAFIVLVTFPLALIGVFVGMAIFHVNLSFPGLIGILALFGIVVKNAIILIDKINLNLKSGILFEDAVVDAGKSRLEAIFITSICTVFGIIPITLSNETWTALGGAVIFGLSISSFLTLFVVPTLFVNWINPKEKF